MKPLRYEDTRGYDVSDLGIVAFMLTVARASAWWNVSPHVRHMLREIPDAIVDRMVAIEAEYDAIREACHELREREREIVADLLEGNASDPTDALSSLNVPPNAAPDPAGSRSPDEGV